MCMNCYLPEPGIKPTSLPPPALVGRFFIYQLCHLGIDIHFKDHCHQLLLFMTKVGETTLEEVLIRVLIGSTHKSRNCYTGYSRCYWDKSVPPMMTGITEKLLQMHGMRCLHDKCVPLILLLQGCLLQHEGMHFKGCPLFQLKQQIVKCRSLSFVENNQHFVNIGNMPEEPLGWNSKNRLGPLFAKPWDKIQIRKRKIASVLSGLPHLFFLGSRKQTLRPEDCRISLWTNVGWGGSSSL